MGNFWFFFIFSLTFYALTSALLFHRSQHRYVISRSPNILQIGHWANLVEIFTVLFILYYLPQPDSTTWGLEALMDTSHCLMVFCYLVRAYRLNFVFKLDLTKDVESSKFYSLKYRVTQRWAIKTVLALAFPIILTCTIIYLLILITGNSFGIIENGERSSTLFMVDIFIAFILQLSMIVMMNEIRLVVNEYQMLKEMLIVTILLSFTTLYSIFVHLFDKEWLYSSIARNYLLVITSSVFPIVMSYTQKAKLEIITLDMLESFELALQNQESLNTFENFLKNYEKGEGLLYLEIYLSCECCVDLFTPELANSIKEKLLMGSIMIDTVDIDKVFKHMDICNILESVKETLELDYFIPFKGSEEFKQLRSSVYRHEMLSNRLSQTSFLPQVNGLKNTMVGLLSLDD